MVANILPVDPRPNGWGQKVKIQLYQNNAMLIIKLKGMPQHASTYFVFSHTLDPWGGVKCQKHFYLKVVILHIKLMGMEHRAPCKHIYCPYTHPRSLGWGQKFRFFTESSRVAYQIKENET